MVPCLQVFKCVSLLMTVVKMTDNLACAEDLMSRNNVSRVVDHELLKLEALMLVHVRRRT